MKRELLIRVARRPLAARALASIAHAEPWLLIEALGPSLRRRARFGEIRHWPERLDGFEDLAFLFSSNRLNRAIASLDFDEAAYLYRLVRSLEPGPVVEIGRFRGGSTFLLAAALPEGSRVVSYDIHTKPAGDDDGPELDRQLRAALERYGLGADVELVVGDSRTAPPPPELCTLILIDGDHSYEGVRADVERWSGQLRPGGHMLLHDAATEHELASPHRSVARLAAELARGDSDLERAGAAGTLLHLRLAARP